MVCMTLLRNWAHTEFRFKQINVRETIIIETKDAIGVIENRENWVQGTVLSTAM